MKGDLARILGVIGRHVLCRAGYHSKPGGVGFDACGRGCGFVRNPDAAKQYEVLLKSGERFEVDAINEYHAASVVVYGGAKAVMDQFGTPLCEVKVHRENIETVRLLDAQ